MRRPRDAHRPGRGLVYRGSPIGRLPLVKLFASVLRRAPDGGYWLVTPVEQGRVEVEDAPFVAVEHHAGRVRASAALPELRTSLEEWVPVDGAHPLDARPAADGALVTHACGSVTSPEARVNRPVFYHLAELAEPSPRWC